MANLPNISSFETEIFCENRIKNITKKSQSKEKPTKVEISIRFYLSSVVVQRIIRFTFYQTLGYEFFYRSTLSVLFLNP